jgi:hypothetical protein
MSVSCKPVLRFISRSWIFVRLRQIGIYGLKIQESEVRDIPCFRMGGDQDLVKDEIRQTR